VNHAPLTLCKQAGIAWSHVALDVVKGVVVIQLTRHNVEEPLIVAVPVMTNTQMGVNCGIVDRNQWPGSLNVNEGTEHLDGFQPWSAEIRRAEDPVVMFA
jgi:hypothetical protein